MAILVGMVVLYSIAFHIIMRWEGQDHSWVTGFYWTLTVMTTLGLGDITFHSDAGRIFSMVVMASGVVFLLTLLPFTFIQFFYAPWIEAQAALRAPRELPAGTRGHVLLTSHDPVSAALIRKLEASGRHYAVIVPELKEALELHDLGVRVALGDLDDPQTYERLRAADAAMLMTAQSDALNTNISFTARGVAPDLLVVSTANAPAAVEILRRAGASHVIRLSELMGQALARCTLGGDAVSHVVAEVDEVLIAEASAARTPLVGRTRRENRLSDLGVSVLGVWERGRFDPATADNIVHENAILVLAGSRAQLDNYDEHFAIYNVSGRARDHPRRRSSRHRHRPGVARARHRVADRRAAARSGPRPRPHHRRRRRQPRDPRAGRNPGHARGAHHHARRQPQHLPHHLLPQPPPGHPNHLTLHPRAQRRHAPPGRGRPRALLREHGRRNGQPGTISAKARRLPRAHARPPADPAQSGAAPGHDVAVHTRGAEINPPASRPLAADEELVLVGGLESESRFRAAFGL